MCNSNEKSSGFLRMNETFGQRLSQVLSLYELNQSEFAKKVSASPTFVSDMVRDVKKPGSDFLERLGRIFNVDLNWLLLGEGSITKSQFNHDFLQFVAMRVELARMVVEGNKVAQSIADELHHQITDSNIDALERQIVLNHLSRIADYNVIVSGVYNEFIAQSDSEQISKKVFQSAIDRFKGNTKDPLFEMIATRVTFPTNE